MRIRELLEDGPGDGLSLKLSAIVNQIAARYIETGTNGQMSLTALLKILGKAGINIPESDFRDMVTKEPLSNTIANIEGDRVTFIGQRKDTSPSVKPDQTTHTLEKMAKRAADKRD